jgi:putative ABC transport system permease protein
VPAAVPVLGLLAVGGGCLLLFASVGLGASTASSFLPFLTAVLGSLGVLGGCAAIAPVVVGALERGVGRSPTSWRLAGRSLARSRLRSSAVVAAVVAATSVLVAGSALVATAVGERRPFDDLGGLPADVVLVSGIAGAGDEEVGAVLPDATPVDLATLDASVSVPWDEEGSHTRDVGGALLATPEVIDAYEVPDELRAVLADGGWVSAVDLGEAPVTLEVSHIGAAGEPFAWSDPEDPWRRAQVPLAGSFDSPLASWAVPVILVGEGAAADLGLEEDLFRAKTLFDLPAPLDADQREALDELSVSGARDDRGLTFSVTTPPSGHQWTPAQVRALILAAVFAAVLAVVATGLLLAGRDSADEAAVLAAVGAPPRVLRRVGAVRAAMLVATGVALAVPAGLLAAWSIFQAVASDVGVDGWFATFRVDGTVLVFTLVLAPLVGALTWVAGGLRDLARPARPQELASWD